MFREHLASPKGTCHMRKLLVSNAYTTSKLNCQVRNGLCGDKMQCEHPSHLQLFKKVLPLVHFGWIIFSVFRNYC